MLAPNTIYRQDYQIYPFEIPKITLCFDLDPDLTQVTSCFDITPKTASAHDLVLNGEDIDLVAVYINDEPLANSAYKLDENSLTLFQIAAPCSVKIINTCKPRQNTTLMGLYTSGTQLFTQCEAEGFRRITWFADRPDVMSIYTVELRAHEDQYPTLLSNGNLIESNKLPDGRLQTRWHDPFAKPCYLFALVAGNFDLRETNYTLSNGKSVLLQLYSDIGTYSQTEFAMQALQRSIAWDAQRFGLLLDLDRFMIVATRDFNMGAMENKGLNVFNASYILANPETATDTNFIDIEAVIGHEYFHNWTGNRVTCRDWFQLSLKEGLTVFREQEFTADMMASGLSDTEAMSARSIKRIDDVQTLRTAQFPEDKGPMAHPIRPNSYQEIGNFYTATIYEKGAEVIRMLHTLLGEDGFQQGLQNYFSYYDGQAVTCDDFVNAMDEVYQRQNPGKNLSIFKHWYEQAGTPSLNIHSNYDQQTKTYTLTIKQSNPAVGIEDKNTHKPPLLIPIKLGLVPQTEQDAPISELLILDSEEKTWTFKDYTEAPIPSLLRDFSAPVTIHYPYSDSELLQLAKSDSNAFNRWDSIQQLIYRVMEQACVAHALPNTSPLELLWQHQLQDVTIDPGYKAQLISLPSFRQLFESLSQYNVQDLYRYYSQLKLNLARTNQTLLLDTYQALHKKINYQFNATEVGQRALKNTALSFLSALQDPRYLVLAQQQYEQSDNMTDRYASLSCLSNDAPSAQAQRALDDFYTRFEDYPNVIDKWFMLQATANATNSATIRTLMQHPAFTLRNPNRARSVIFQFCLNNPQNFHSSDGSGYQLWYESVLELNTLNPEIAARLARVFDRWNNYYQREKMHSFLQMLNNASLSRNVTEIINKALENS